VRVRRAGNRHFVDATVSVARTASLEQVHALSNAIENALARSSRGCYGARGNRAHLRASTYSKRFARWHKVWASPSRPDAVQQAGQLFIELHLEVDENLSLREAHRQATELEEKIRELRDGPIEVNIHIEPLGKHIANTDAGIGR